MSLFLPIPANETTIDKTLANEWIPDEVPEWDLRSVQAGLGPVLPVPLKNPPGREDTATLRLNGWEKVLVRITSD